MIVKIANWQEQFSLCISNEAIKGKLDSQIKRPSNYTDADQLAATVQLNAADYEREVNKIFPWPTVKHESAFIKHCQSFNNSDDWTELTSVLIPLYW